jgi:hypothetical protein
MEEMSRKKRLHRWCLSVTALWAVGSIAWMANWVSKNSFQALVTAENFPIDLMFSFGPLLGYLIIRTGAGILSKPK